MLLVATASAATSTTATTAAVSAATTAATATAAIFSRTSFIHGERTTFVLGFVQPGNGRLRFGVAFHLDETEAFAPTRFPVGNNLSAFHGAKLGKQLLQI
jgi:hypothetical protein